MHLNPRYIIAMVTLVFGTWSCRKLSGPQSGLQEDATNPNPVFLGSAEQAQFMQALPETTDGFIADLKANYRIEFYNDSSLTQVMQYTSPKGSGPQARNSKGGERGKEYPSQFPLPNPPQTRGAYKGARNAKEPMFDAIFDLGNNFTGQDDPVGNPNNEFPWLRSSGTDRMDNLEQVKFIAIKRDAKINYQMKDIGEATTNMIPIYLTWEFPELTVSGEMLFMTTPVGKILFELRINKKSGRQWFGRIYRPFAKPYQLADALEQLLEAGNLKQIAASIRAQSSVKTDSISNYIDAAHMNRNVMAPKVLAATVTTLELPEIPCDVLTGLMKRPFVPVNGRPFYSKGSQSGFAPMTQANCQIVPKKYFGHFLEVSKSSCSKCHQTVLGDATYFAGSPNPNGSGRFWYGRVRGSDHVFTFHPFDPSWISKEKIAQQPGSYVKMLNQKLVASGLLVEGETGNVFFPGF